MAASKRGEPDWERMTEICDEADRLQQAGKLTRSEFNRLFKLYVAATNGNEQFAEGMTPYAQPGWV